MVNLKTETIIVSEKQLEYEKYLNNGNIKPKDKFYFTYFLFGFLGLTHFLPLTFFLTANSYWMYKFRDTKINDITNADARTTLQSYFASYLTVAQTVPTVIFSFIVPIIGHKIKATTRVLVSILIQALTFIYATGFVMVDTDSWQTGFFILTMVEICVISAANSVTTVSLFAILAKFPEKNTKFYLIGEGTAGIFNGMLQIISLAIGTSVSASGLIYFVAGSCIMMAALVLFYVGHNLEFFRYYMEHTKDDTKKDMIKMSEFREVLKIIWPSVFVLAVLFATLNVTHTSITSLVVSENKGNEWSDKYFVPVITFLFGDFCAMGGRIVSAIFDKVWSKTTMAVGMVFRMILFVPLIMLCNAKPRTHLPVIFNHDWEYALILGLFCFSNGYCLNVCILYISKVLPKHKIELGFMVLMICLGIFGGGLSPLGIFAVKLL